MSNERVLKMTNQGIFFTKEYCTPYSNTNLPKKYFDFNNRTTIYWHCELHKSEREGKLVLLINILDYRYKGETDFNKQELKNYVPYLIFEKLDYHQFFALCVSYSPNKIADLFFNFPNPDWFQSSRKESLEEKEWKRKLNAQSEPVIKTLSFNFRYKFSEAVIVEKGVEVTVFINAANCDCTFTIPNDSLKKEYNNIISYFSKKLNRKTFQVDAWIKLVDSIITEKTCSSSEIELITADFLKAIKYNQIQSLKKLANTKDNKKIYAIDDILAQSADLAGNIFNSSIDDIIRVLTGEYTHRNSRQLQYLAGEHEANEEIVYVTLSPYFGFVFFLHSPNRLHYIWELLDSHATYIWSFDKYKIAKEQAFKIVEDAINNIHAAGRNEYKKIWKSMYYQLYHFSHIDHPLDETGQITVFEKWLTAIKENIA